MRTRCFAIISFLAAITAIAGCGKRQTAVPAELTRPECVLFDAGDGTPEVITVALFDPVKPEHAPYPRNDSERLLFHNLYETLISADCIGEIRSGLASSWERKDRGRLWVFRMRDDALFWDGERVSAYDVERSWSGRAYEKLLLAAGIDSVRADDERTVSIFFGHPRDDVPAMLSLPEFSVARYVDYSRWPLGSGPYRIAERERDSAGNFRRIMRAYPAGRAREPVIDFKESSSRDARDLLESGIDLLVTSDPSVLEYAGTQSEYSTIPLPWDRTYMLLSTSRVKGIQRGEFMDVLPAGFCALMAQDAVRGDARGFEGPAWWNEVPGCEDLSRAVKWPPLVLRGAMPSSGTRRILYDSTDGIARGLSERIIALASADAGLSAEAAALAEAVPGFHDRSGIAAEGVQAGALRSSLLKGDDYAYVIAVERRVADPCYSACRLVQSAEWLPVIDDEFPSAMIPLVDTRSHAVVRSGCAVLTVDWYGNILVKARR